MSTADWRTWRDESPRSGPWNMALDEALLAASAAAGVPVLRLYRWEVPAVSFGYFDRLAEVQTRFPDRAPVRRWTGGGAVEHGADVTFSLVAPRGHPFAELSALDSYRAIHRLLVEVLRDLGLPAELAGPSPTRSHPGQPAPCFVAPVCADVMVDGRKVAGGAQRRTRVGLLHQGSLQGPGIAALEDCLRDRLAQLGEPWLPGEADLYDAAEALVRTRYGTTEWLARW